MIGCASGRRYMEEDEDRTREFLTPIARDLGIPTEIAAGVHFYGSGDLGSAFAVSDLAAAATAAAGAAVGELLVTSFGVAPRISGRRRLASRWFGFSIGPIGWTLPAPWDPIAGDYATAD